MTSRCARSSAVFVGAVALWMATTTARAEPGVTYTFRFPEPEHHWMAVEASFTGLPVAPLELRMSRSSPGRYSLHDFAKNVYDVEATDSGGSPLKVARPDDSGWMISEHRDAVTIR